MPPDALHSAMTTPMISVVVAPPDERLVADVMAPLKIAAADGGSEESRPWTSCCTVCELMCSRLVSPIKAIRAGNSARNQ
jgi:hypothetical protein